MFQFMLSENGVDQLVSLMQWVETSIVLEDNHVYVSQRDEISLLPMEEMYPVGAFCRIDYNADDIAEMNTYIEANDLKVVIKYNPVSYKVVDRHGRYYELEVVPNVGYVLQTPIEY